MHLVYSGRVGMSNSKSYYQAFMGKSAKTLAFFVLGIVLPGCAVMQRVAETLSESGLSEARDEQH